MRWRERESQQGGRIAPTECGAVAEHIMLRTRYPVDDALAACDDRAQFQRQPPGYAANQGRAGSEHVPRELELSAHRASQCR